MTKPVTRETPAAQAAQNASMGGRRPGESSPLSSNPIRQETTKSAAAIIAQAMRCTMLLVLAGRCVARAVSPAMWIYARRGVRLRLARAIPSGASAPETGLAFRLLPWA
jgi:hypothetical protein